MDPTRQLAWRSAVVPVSAKGRARVLPDEPAPDAIPPSLREQAIAAMVSWCRTGDPPVWLIEGPAASGKTRLAADVADRLSEGLLCGWARPGLGAFAATAAARNGRAVLLLVDDGDTRADLLSILEAVTKPPRTVRLIITARDFGGWWSHLLTRLPPVPVTAGHVLIGEPSAAGPPSGTLARRETRLATGDAAADTLARADPGSAELLMRQAALVVALSTRVGQLGPAAVRSAMRDLFEEEQGYWRRASAEVTSPGQPSPALRSALASAAVLGEDGLAEAAMVLRRVPALAVGAADRLARMAVWWHGRYTRPGESSATGSRWVPRLPSWLAEGYPDATASNGVSWTVSTLDVERRVTATLAGMALDAHRDVWPTAALSAGEGHAVGDGGAIEAYDGLRRAVAAAGPVDEALAWLTAELDLSDDQLDALAGAIDYPSRELRRTGVAIARRLVLAAGDGRRDGDARLDGDTRRDGDARLEGDPGVDGHRAGLVMGLGARYSALGRWDEARQHTQEALDAFTRLVATDRPRYLPELAGATANLAACLAQLGENEDALTHGYEAVTLYRELVIADPEPYVGELARALTNLAACLSRCGRRTGALGTAGQAVALYRELATVHPTRYATELASAEHNWQVCRSVLGEPVAGARPAPA